MKRVFLSYAWSSASYQSKIEKIAIKLHRAGVECVLDKWDLRAGYDTTFFMEQVLDPKIDHIIVFCNNEYRIKADERKGGVGIETTLIRTLVDNKPVQDRVIPVILEKDSSGVPCVPKFLLNRLYVDFAGGVNSRESFEQLINAIAGKSGRPPGFDPLSRMNEIKSDIQASLRGVRIARGEPEYVVEAMHRFFSKTLSDPHLETILFRERKYRVIPIAMFPNTRPIDGIEALEPDINRASLVARALVTTSEIIQYDMRGLEPNVSLYNPLPKDCRLAIMLPFVSVLRDSGIGTCVVSIVSCTHFFSLDSISLATIRSMYQQYMDRVLTPDIDFGKG